MSKRTMAISVVVLVGLLFCTFGSSERSLLAQGESTVGPQAVVTPLLQYQGRLSDPITGDPVADGTYEISFRLYNVEAGGTPLWTETEDVPVHGGLFSNVLGDSTALEMALFSGQALWLAVKVGADTEATPRQPVLPVAYAMSLVPGAKVEGAVPRVPAGAYMGVISGRNTETSSMTAHMGIYGEASSDGGYGVYGYNPTLGGRGVGGNGNRYGVFGQADSAEGRGVHGYASAATGTTYGVSGESSSDGGRGVYGYSNASTGHTIGVYGRANSPDGWAGYFINQSGKGVYIHAEAGYQGLTVVGGSKNAMVGTDDGSRLLYTEESSEVWFTDYGFGALDGGQATVAIDHIFAQTVNLTQPYHVFVQVYGDAQVYVSHRTPTQFVVRLHEGDENVEFSYRIVAKRLGFEDKRLERLSEADSDPSLYPELLSQGQEDHPLKEPGGPPNEP